MTADVIREWNCSSCHGTGMVFAVRLGDWVEGAGGGHEWTALDEHDRTTPTIFRCTCYRGANDRRAFPSWADANQREFRMAKV